MHSDSDCLLRQQWQRALLTSDFGSLRKPQVVEEVPHRTASRYRNVSEQEVVPALVEIEVAVPHLRLAEW